MIELQEFEFSYLVEESMRVTLADLLTYKEIPFFIKEEIVKKVAKEVKEISNAHVLFFDGSYRKIHDAASGGIVLYDPQGKLVCKQGFKVDAHSKKGKVLYTRVKFTYLHQAWCEAVVYQRGCLTSSEASFGSMEE